MNNTTDIGKTFDRLRRKRREGINKILAGMVPSGCPKTDRFEAAIRYDSDAAPLGTNADMLRMVGVDPDCTHDGLTDEEANHRMFAIVVGLSMWNIYLSGTNHLTDRGVLDVLRKSLAAEVRIIPPVRMMAEIIDLNPNGITTATADRDRILPKPRKQISEVDKAVQTR